MSRKQLHTLRQRVQTNLNTTAPADVMTGTTFEADELYQNAGGKKARRILIQRTRPGGEPTSAKDTAPTPAIVPPSSA
jgi:hypothetical protein